eukprot:scaffold18296_cov32-Tisochrysis_lutea.AAC.2
MSHVPSTRHPSTRRRQPAHRMHSLSTAAQAAERPPPPVGERAAGGGVSACRVEGVCGIAIQSKRRGFGAAPRSHTQ